MRCEKYIGEDDCVELDIELSRDGFSQDAVQTQAAERFTKPPSQH